MLGFRPERSFVVAVLQRSECDPPEDVTSLIASLIRLDLDHPADLMAEVVVQICGTAGSSAVLAVIVDDRVTDPPTGDLRDHAQAALIDAIAQRLDAFGNWLGQSWATPAIEPGRLWWSLLGQPREGMIPDPGTSVVTAALSARGESVYASRSELVALVEPDQPVVDQVRVLLPDAKSAVLQRALAGEEGGMQPLSHVS